MTKTEKKDKHPCMMNLEELQTLTKRYQQELLVRMSEQMNSYVEHVEGIDIICQPKVFPPATDSKFLVKTVRVKSTDTVLEPCAGTGFISVYLAQKVACVHATDISEFAVQNIQANIEKHNCSDKVKVFCADLFPPEKYTYDIIVINPPYSNYEPATIVERSVWDENNATVKKFLAQAPQYLAPQGRIYLSWSNFADFELIENLIEKNGFIISQVQETRSSGKEFIVYRVYELKPKEYECVQTFKYM